MIKYNNKTINEWYFNDAELIKVYKNGAICYYKMVLGETPHQEPCFAVVDDITQYSDTEFIDVYDKATEKWYKLNNLDQYEEYGVYGEGRNITYYVGKLTIDEGYEYEWDGSEWSNLGEVSGSSIIIHSPEYLERTSSSSGYLPLGETFQLNTTIEMDFQMTQAKGNAIIGDYGTNDSNDWRLFLNYDTRVNNLLSYDFIKTRAQYNTGNWAKRFNIRIGNYYVDDIDTGTRLINSTRKTSFTRPNQMYLFHMQGSQITNNTDYGHIYSVKIYQDGTLVKDYIPWTDGNGTYGMWDKVSNQSVTSVGQMTGSSVVHDIDVGDEPEYPKYYTEKDEPENNVVFTDMAEALAYQCPWVGMDVTIDNTPYLFGDAYEWLTKYGLFEVSGEYMCYNGDKYERMEEMVRNVDGTWSSQIPAVYEKGDLIEAGSTDCALPYEEQYLTFVAEVDNVSFQLAGGVNGNTFQYSIDDGSTWNNVSIGQTTSSINTGDKIMFKASSLSIEAETGIGTIRPSGSASVEGNIMSLVYGDNFVGQTSITNNFQFRKLFSGSTNITSAENMVLPATTFTKQCYSQMFQGCTNLTTPPKVVGTATARFNGDYCFSDMFNSCTSLTKAPELPMTSLGTQCYWYMFQGCTSLTASPLLEAPTINTQSYGGMFYGCTSLNSITCLATAGISTNNCNSWVTNVPSSGTFTKAASMTSWTTGVNGIPNGWTVQNDDGSPVISLKYTATYTDGTVVTASCGDSDSVLVINEISKTNLKTVVLGECVTRISGECFSDCSKLESVTIEGNTTIDAYSFARNNGTLKTIRMQATTPPQCNSKAFTYYKSGSGYIPMESIRIYVPSASLNAYKAASGWKTYSSKIYGY